MGKIYLDPYLFFDGNCKEAMEFYKTVFGGKLEMQTMGEAPVDMPDKKARKNQIMHALLSGGDIKLMASDSSKASPKAAKIELSLSGPDEDKLRKIFSSLGKGGKVNAPLEKQFWGDIFGQLRDKFGIDWMINITVQK